MLGQVIGSYLAGSIDKDSNRIVWEGKADIPGFVLRGTAIGIGHVRLDVTGPDNFHAEHFAALDVQSVRARDSVIVAVPFARRRVPRCLPTARCR